MQGGHIEKYSINNTTVSSPLVITQPYTPSNAASAINTTSYICGSAFALYWSQLSPVLPGYEVYANSERQYREFTNHYFNYYENNGNLFSYDNGVMSNFNVTNVQGGSSPMLLASTSNINGNPIYTYSGYTTYRDLQGYSYIINLSSSSILTEKLNLPRNYTIPVENFWTGNINHENFSFLNLIAYNDAQRFNRRTVTYTTKHNSSGNILEVEEPTGMVHFSVPDNSSTTGYKTFTILHGFSNDYPFKCTREVVSDTVMNFAEGPNTTRNNFYGSSPVRCCFHDST